MQQIRTCHLFTCENLGQSKNVWCVYRLGVCRMIFRVSCCYGFAQCPLFDRYRGGRFIWATCKMRLKETGLARRRRELEGWYFQDMLFYDWDVYPENFSGLARLQGGLYTSYIYTIYPSYSFKVQKSVIRVDRKCWCWTGTSTIARRLKLSGYTLNG